LFGSHHRVLSDGRTVPPLRGPHAQTSSPVCTESAWTSPFFEATPPFPPFLRSSVFRISAPSAPSVDSP
jgi:hypothetical protein